VIQSDATARGAGLGHVDFVIDPPFRGSSRTQAQADGDGRIGTQYLGFRATRRAGIGRHQGRALSGRSRAALIQAIDVGLIVSRCCAGRRCRRFAPSQMVDGHVPEFERRPATRHFAQIAGGRDTRGFAVTLDCVNVTYRAAVCQAIAAMLAQVGIRVSFQPSPSATFFPKLTQASASFFEFGWTPGTDPG
jgi:peptide/nickel transport system substrate-binding protein